MDGRRWNKSAALRCSPHVRRDGPYPAASTTLPEAIPIAHHPCIIIGAHGLIEGGISPRPFDVLPTCVGMVRTQQLQRLFRKPFPSRIILVSSSARTA